MRLPHIVLAATVATFAASVPGPHTAAAATTLTSSWSHTVSVGPGSAGRSHVSNEPFGGATAGDLFGDGRKEVVAGFLDGSVWVFDGSTGAVLPGWPRHLGGPLHTNPTVADLFGDGREEVVAASEAGWVYVFNGNGSNVPGWPRHTLPGASNVSPGIFGGVAVGDLFGDGRKELVAAAWDQHLFAWFSNGALVPGFPIHMWDSAFDTPALADLEHRGQLDIVVGVDSSGPPWDPYPVGGEYWAFRPSGCITNAYANRQPCALPGWPRTFNETPWSSPAAVDLRHTGTPDVVAGSGFMMPLPAGRYVNAWTASGAPLSGWPQATAGRNMASVAVGDLFGNGSRDVVAASENGWLYAWDASGHLLPGWPRNPGCAGRLVSNPTIGPIGAGSANGVWITATGCGADLIAYNGAGQVVLQASGLEWGSDAAPAIADLGDGHLSAVTLDQANGTGTAWTVRAYPIPGATHMLPGAWPTFHGNSALSGTIAPTATLSALAPAQTTTAFTLNWTLDAGSTPASRYEIWVRDHAGSRWMLYGHTTATSMPFAGYPGHTYSFAVQAESRGAEQDVAFSGAAVTTTVSSTAAWSTPFHAMYALAGTGQLDPGTSPPMAVDATWENWDIARGVALVPGGQGGYVLDGWGGLHPFGNALPVSGGGYWHGWDIARAIALRPDGHSGYVLDGWGGLHPFGTAGDMPPAVAGGGYWHGWDIARDVELRPDGRSGYVLDGWGGLHPFGAAGDMPPGVTGGGYWPHWDIARRFALDGAGTGGYVLEGWGGLHAFGTGLSAMPPPKPLSTGYWRGWDIARGVAFVPGSSTQGYVVDGWGGFHPFNGAPPAFPPQFSPSAGVHDLDIS